MWKKKYILLAFIIAASVCPKDVFAQNYDRYNYFHDEAVKLKNEGKLDEAKEKFKKIRVICQGGIPENNDLDKMIRECTTISLSESNLQFGANGGQTKSVNVKSNAESFKVSSNSKWCKVGKKGNSVSVSCDKNDLPNVRNAVVLVSADGKTVSLGVSQSGCELQLKAVPDSVHFSKHSETVGISIITNATSWQLDSIPDWIEYDANDTMLYLTSMKNNLAWMRSATVSVVAAGERFPIKVCQAESDTTILTDREELVFPSAESEDMLLVESNLSKWQVLPSEDWIHVSVELDTVKVRVDGNVSPFSRHGSIRIGLGQRFCKVLVHQIAFVSEPPKLLPEIKDNGLLGKGAVAVESVPSDLKVTVIDDAGECYVRHTPFDIPIDYGHYSLQMGLEQRDVFANERQQDVVFKPGLRFATLTWSPGMGFGMMSGFVGSKSWGAYTHFQANTPLVSDFNGDYPGISGYNMTFGPVFRHNAFPYLGAYAGIGVGGYVKEPHIGLDFEAGMMGFYRNMMVSMGFHTSFMNSSANKTAFMVGVGGYLKRYYDARYGYCSSDSRRWISLNYVFRPAERGKGMMVSDIGRERVRGYVKVLYLSPTQASDSIAVRNLEGGGGVVFTPVSSLIDLCLGASATANISGLEKRFQGVGLELGCILNLWRFPLTVFMHEADLFGEPHLCVDFGIGFHLGEFGKAKSSYQ